MPCVRRRAMAIAMRAFSSCMDQLGDSLRQGQATHAGLPLELRIDFVRDFNGPAHKASFDERSDALESSPYSRSLAVGILQQPAETGSTLQLLPIHVSFHPRRCLLVVVSMGHRAVECKLKRERW